MKKLIFIYLILGLCFSLLADERGRGELIFRDVVKDDYSSPYKITAIIFLEDGVLIEAQKDKSCFMPFDGFFPNWKAESNCPGAPVVAVVKADEIHELKEMFFNVKGEYKVECTRREKEVVGYSFTGRTEFDGTPAFVQRSMAFDLSKYPMPEPDRPSAVENLARDVGGFLWKYLLKPN